MFIVLCLALSGLQHFTGNSMLPCKPISMVLLRIKLLQSNRQASYFSQNIDRLQADSIIWPSRWVRIWTSHNRILKRCCCWLRMIFRLSLGNTLTDQLLCLHFVLPPPNFLRGITFSQLGHRGIDARTMIDCYMDCTSANYKADTAQRHIVLRQDAALCDKYHRTVSHRP